MNALIIVESGFQDEEFLYPYYRLKEAGWTVDVASPNGEEKKGKYGLPARVNARRISELNQVNYDALLIPGGFECPDRLRTNKDVLELVRSFDRHGKLIAAICHGPWVLISAGLVKGRTMTAYESVKVDLANAGANVTMASCVRDGNLITAEHYRDLGLFMQAILNHKPWPINEVNVV